MEQQNPQENETSPNIETGKSQFLLFLKAIVNLFSYEKSDLNSA